MSLVLPEIWTVNVAVLLYNSPLSRVITRYKWSRAVLFGCCDSLPGILTKSQEEKFLTLPQFGEGSHLFIYFRQSDVPRRPVEFVESNTSTVAQNTRARGSFRLRGSRYRNSNWRYRLERFMKPTSRSSSFRARPPRLGESFRMRTSHAILTLPANKLQVQRITEGRK